MLTREQIYTMLILRNREGNVFSAMPAELINAICNVGLDTAPDSQTPLLLSHVVHGDLDAVRVMLDDAPSLIAKSGHVTTPSGLLVRFVTPYECALGAGDPEMAAMIAGYFDQFANGAEERERQNAKYRPHIEAMMTRQPYDFAELARVLRTASLISVNALLAGNWQYPSFLRDELMKFRKVFTPAAMAVGMHFNYQDLLHAYEVYKRDVNYLEDDISNYLYITPQDQENFDKRCVLFSRMVIGFIQGRLPAIDRMVFAQQLDDGVVLPDQFVRTFDFRYPNGLVHGFPLDREDVTISGLGERYCVEAGGPWLGMISHWTDVNDGRSKFIADKWMKLRAVVGCPVLEQRSWCSIL